MFKLSEEEIKSIRDASRSDSDILIEYFELKQEEQDKYNKKMFIIGLLAVFFLLSLLLLL